MIDKAKLNSYLNKDQIQLSKTEQVIHDYVIGEPERIVYNNLQQISNILEVGEASIVRYFKKLGFSNFVNFKMAIYAACEEIRVKKNLPYVDNIAQNMKDAVDNTAKLIKVEDIDAATKLIFESKQVLVTGMGTSNTTAIDLFSKLIRVGINASVLADIHLTYMYASTLNEDYCVVIYSFSGETEEMIKIAKICKENNVKIIGISNYSTSTLAKYSDIFIKTAGFENERNGGFLSSKISQLYVTDVLATACALVNEEKSKKYSERTTNALL